jgi:hypothetical protein
MIHESEIMDHALGADIGRESARQGTFTLCHERMGWMAPAPPGVSMRHNAGVIIC